MNLKGVSVLLVTLMLGMFTCPEVTAFHEVEKFDEDEQGSLSANWGYLDSLLEELDVDEDEEDDADPISLKSSSKSSKSKSSKSKSSKSKSKKKKKKKKDKSSSTSTTYYTTETSSTTVSDGAMIWILSIFAGIAVIIIAVYVYHKCYIKGDSGQDS